LEPGTSSSEQWNTHGIVLAEEAVVSSVRRSETVRSELTLKGKGLAGRGKGSLKHSG